MSERRFGDLLVRAGQRGEIVFTIEATAAAVGTALTHEQASALGAYLVELGQGKAKVWEPAEVRNWPAVEFESKAAADKRFVYLHGRVERLEGTVEQLRSLVGRVEKMEARPEQAYSNLHQRIDMLVKSFERSLDRIFGRVEALERPRVIRWYGK